MKQDTDSDKLIKIFKALSVPVRLQIVNMLLTHDFCVGGLSKKLGITEASVSQHLRVLRQAGLVVGEKRGYYSYYDINKNTFSYAEKALNLIANSNIERNVCRVHTSGDHTCCEIYLNKVASRKKVAEK